MGIEPFLPELIPAAAGMDTALSQDAGLISRCDVTTPLRDKAILPCIRGITGLPSLTVMNDYSIKAPNQLGPVLQGYRRERGLTQKEVGAKVGMTQKAVSKIELDPSRTGLSLIFKILAALDLEIVVRPRGQSQRRSEW
jgi:HTH-type transcriptional regulator/antitoxin HipB